MRSDRDPARIRFEFSAADLANVARRSADRSKTVRDQRWHAAASWSALLALVLFFALDGSFIARAVFSIPFGLAVFFFYFRIWRSTPSGTYLKYYREQLGGDGLFTCEIEITPDGITTSQCGAETKRPWSAVKEINETSDALEFFWCTGGLLAVRNRAFQTSELRSDFLRKSRQFLAESTHKHQSQTHNT
jgi:hypothetical protein